MGWAWTGVCVSREGSCSASPCGDSPDFQRGPGGYCLLLLVEPLLTSPSDLSPLARDEFRLRELREEGSPLRMKQVWFWTITWRPAFLRKAVFHLQGLTRAL